MKTFALILLLILSLNSVAQTQTNKNIISNEEINNSGASNLIELLSKITTLDVLNIPFISAGVGINGTPPSLDNSTVAILLDGRPILVINISDISLINVEKIEIIKGSVSAMYGLNALGGTINIITKKGKTTATNIGGGYGSFERYIIEGFKGERLSNNLYYHLSFQNDRQKDDYKIGNKNFKSLSSDQEIILDPASYGAKMLNSSYNKTFLNAGMGYIINNNWDIYFCATGYSHKKSEVSGSFYQTKGSNNIKNYDQETSNYSFTVNGKIKKHNITINSHYINFTDKIRLDNTDNELDEDTKHIYASVKDKFESKNFNISAALEYRLNKYDDFYHSYPYDGVLHKTPSFKDKVITASLGTNINLFKNKLNINASVRYNMVKYSMKRVEYTLKNSLQDLKYSRNSNLFSPYLCLTFNTSDRSSIYVNWGKSYSTPLSLYKVGTYKKYSLTTYEELIKGDGPVNVITHYHQFGNNDFKERTHNTINIGYKYFTNNINLTINTFYTQQKNFSRLVIIPMSQFPLNPIIFNNTEYYERDYVSTPSTIVDKQKKYGINMEFSYDLKNNILNNCIITPYFKGTYILKNKTDEYEDREYRDDYEDMGYRNNISNLGIKLNHKKKLFCDINMRIASERKVKNSFYHIIKYKYYSDQNIFPEKELIPIKDINGKTIRPEFIDNSQIKLPSYGLLNFSATYHLNKNISLSIFANNILNENYMEVDAYHMPGRNYLAKLKFYFDKFF